MKTNRAFWYLFFSLVAAPALGMAQGTAFTYQGRLSDNRKAANGVYDLQFSLVNALTDGTYVGPTLTNLEVPVTNGLFVTGLDFGPGIFDGTPLWIEIGVRKSGTSDAYTALFPRQPITAAPMATFAMTAASLVGSATNTTVYGSLSLAGSGTSNVVMYATNTSVVTTSADSGVLYVAGAGMNAANGTYYLKSSDPGPLYTNRNGMVLISLPDNPDYQWQIRKNSGKVIYGDVTSDVTDVHMWLVVEPAAAPRPSSIAYGTNYLTNVSSQLLISGAPVPAPSLGNDIYVNAAIGNDLFAQRGRPDLAYKTVYAALRAATNDDTIMIASGTYNEPRFTMTLPPGLKVIGSGRRVTKIYCSPSIGTAAGNIDLRTSNVLSSFTTDFVISAGGYGITLGTATNALLENLEVFGISDVIYLQSWQGFTAINCSFNSRSDCFVDFQADPAGSNAVAELYNCNLRTTGSGEFSNHGLVNGGYGHLRMFGGSIEARNSKSSVCVWSPAGGPPGGTIEISGVSLNYGTTNTAGAGLAIANESGTNCTITVKGMLLRTAEVFGAVTYEGDLYRTNLVGDIEQLPAVQRRSVRR